ncbi:MAG: hypothetical protein JO022_13260 [Acidobacteriaceae bacterium]|nr:hypothetical protein [Acidobacteriaceae bacterium]
MPRLVFITSNAMLSAYLLLFFSPAPSISETLEKLKQSGRILEIATPASERVSPPMQIPPGAPPLLTFRMLERQSRSRYNDLDLVLDDAGH